MESKYTGNQIRKSFIDFFISKGHTYVPSSSLVPGGDSTLLFTNAGMVQFKDVFLGTDKRPYTRAANSQKCMRVAGKHNDLDDVGRDDSHHTFFEMLGNWSFGDYYKKEAITWAWELLTDVWKLDKSNLWVTVFRDEKGEIPTDEEAADVWRTQPGISQDHILYFGRKDNFWEMADTGPCGPCSEIHIDRGTSFCNRKDEPGHICGVNGDCSRFLELWNLVFIQYNRLSETRLDSLPSTHVDTGMGFERIVAVLQGVDSNYKTDLFQPFIDEIRKMTGQSINEVYENYTPYRVIADHARAATFLIADGVVPGNTGRNYICRMIIRRAARFGGKIGLNEPFLANVSKIVIRNYGEAYPELVKNRTAILDSITREEERFQKTLQTGLTYLSELFSELHSAGVTVLDGERAFDLYATHGLPLEITRDIAREQGMDVDEKGFHEAMETHRVASGAGKAFGALGGEDVDIYREEFQKLLDDGKIPYSGVKYDPYHRYQINSEIIAIFKDGESVEVAKAGDMVEILLPETCFYVESGGQVSDIGTITHVESDNGSIEISEMRKPAAGVIVHVGQVKSGEFRVGDDIQAVVDVQRRKDIMRNHTATHLLHAELRKVLGNHARQAGSLVAPDRLRFDFTHPEALTADQIERIEIGVNENILENYHLNITEKSLNEAIAEGATALFGEKYGEKVRTIQIGDETPFSYELCGGTHVDETGDIGTFIITSEGSAAAGIRRIEAVTGRTAYEVLRKRTALLKESAKILNTTLDLVPERIENVITELEAERKEISRLRKEFAGEAFDNELDNVIWVDEIAVLTKMIPEADDETLRSLTDKFKAKYNAGVIVLGSVINDKPLLIAGVSEAAINKGIHAGKLVKEIASRIGGGGGGRPSLAQAGGRFPEKLDQALAEVIPFVKHALNQ